MALDNHRLFLAYEAVFCPCFITYSEKVNEPYRSLIKRLLLLNFPQGDPRFWFAPTRWLAIPTPIGLTVRTYLKPSSQLQGGTRVVPLLNSNGGCIDIDGSQDLNQTILMCPKRLQAHRTQYVWPRSVEDLEMTETNSR